MTPRSPSFPGSGPLPSAVHYLHVCLVVRITNPPLAAHSHIQFFSRTGPPGFACCRRPQICFCWPLGHLNARHTLNPDQLPALRYSRLPPHPRLTTRLHTSHNIILHITESTLVTTLYYIPSLYLTLCVNYMSAFTVAATSIYSVSAPLTKLPTSLLVSPLAILFITNRFFPVTSLAAEPIIVCPRLSKLSTRLIMRLGSNATPFAQ